MKKWYNVTLDDLAADDVRSYCKGNGIYYEASGRGDLVHMEIHCTALEASNIDSILK